MKVLALEFSSAVRSIAVIALESGSAPPVIMASAAEEKGKASRPMALIELALKAARLEREAIEGLVIALGPGSYTGVRSAIALAQGWQLARSVTLIGVSSADALAAAAKEKGWLGHVGVVIDAQRGEFYFAGYEVAASGWQLADPLRIATNEEAEKLAADYETIVGPEATKFFERARVLCPEAKLLGGLAKGRSDFTAGENLEPIYLRETRFLKAPPPRVARGL
jgi:tRNA threonylcarbamoyladenosine biosynthesis protein TsaB